MTSKLLLIILCFVAFSCKKDTVLRAGQVGGDITYKDSVTMNISLFDLESSTVNININNYPLPDDFGKVTLNLKTTITAHYETGFEWNHANPYSIMQAPISIDTTYKLGTFSKGINKNYTKNIISDSSNTTVNMCYLFIEFNNREQIISDILAWQDSIQKFPFNR